MWLNPRPVPEDMHKVFSPWSSNGKRDRLYGLRKRLKEASLAALGGKVDRALPLTTRIAASGIRLLPPLREIVAMKVSGLAGPPQGRLVDVGPGSGEFLATMRDLGWDVVGVEPDPNAAQAAIDAYQVKIVLGELEETHLPSGFADVVTLNHVIEHLADPIRVLKECRRILRPGGRLVLLTPNIQSWGHKVFSECWLPLEQPRHFILYSPETLAATVRAAGFSIGTLRTTARNARGVWRRSHAIKRKGDATGKCGGLTVIARGLAFQALEELLRKARPQAGEELYLTAKATSHSTGAQHDKATPSS
jgi:2-polyprenyl-3-methyl-5-hydroxy-6-metoxy-1,4-benzoquinol methylase